VTNKVLLSSVLFFVCLGILIAFGSGSALQFGLGIVALIPLLVVVCVTMMLVRMTKK
jgi:hypothetical protein